MVEISKTFHLNVFLFPLLHFCSQIRKIRLVCKGTLQLAEHLRADVDKEGQILARTQVKGRFHIRVLNKLGREMSTPLPSECDHDRSVFLIAHPTDAGFVLESCTDCGVIRNYNIQTGQCSVVYKRYILYRIYHGPTGSILTTSSDIFKGPELLILNWDKEDINFA